MGAKFWGSLHAFPSALEVITNAVKCDDAAKGAEWALQGKGVDGRQLDVANSLPKPYAMAQLGAADMELQGQAVQAATEPPPAQAPRSPLVDKASALLHKRCRVGGG